MYFTPCSSVSFVKSEYVNAGGVGCKAVRQILQIYKILSVVHVFVYFGYFFKSMYSYHEMVNFMQIDMEGANARLSKK